MNWETFIHYAEQLALGGVASFLVFIALLPTKFGEKLLAHHFDAKIADLKHEQGVELARLRADLDHLKDRGIRSNEREYQAITGVWEGFVDAFQATKGCVMQFIMSPDLARMPEGDVMEFLRAEEFSESHAARIAASDNRNSAYTNAIGARMINRAGEAVMKAGSLLQKQCVFVPHPLSLQFETAIQFLHGARIEQYMALRSPSPGGLKNAKSEALIGSEGTLMFERLRDAVRDRLLRALNEDRKADTEIRAG